MTDKPEHTKAAHISPDPVDRATIGSARATIITAVIKAVATVAAIVAIVISLHSLNVAEEQNTNAQVQALLSLVTAIAQEPSNMAQAAESIKDNPGLLNTENALFTAQDTLVQVKYQHLQALVDLYQALGGGWRQAQADQ